MITPIQFGPFTDGFFETGSQVHDWIMSEFPDARSIIDLNRDAWKSMRNSRRGDDERGGEKLSRLLGLPQKPDTWEEAFRHESLNRNEISEPLILPEVSAHYDIPDLLDGLRDIFYTFNEK